MMDCVGVDGVDGVAGLGGLGGVGGGVGDVGVCESSSLNGISAAVLASVWSAIPSNPVRQFQLLYCMRIATTMLLHLRQYSRFYDWFYSSGLSLASKHGFGARPSKLYGLFTPPALTPPQLCLTGYALTGCLLGSCTPVAPRVFLLVAAILYLLYFPQLYAESTVSGHNSILLQSTLLLLSCSPSLGDDVLSSSVWTLQLIRIYTSSASLLYWSESHDVRGIVVLASFVASLPHVIGCDCRGVAVAR